MFECVEWKIFSFLVVIVTWVITQQATTEHPLSFYFWRGSVTKKFIFYNGVATQVVGRGGNLISLDVLQISPHIVQ